MKPKIIKVLAVLFILGYGGYIFLFAPILRERSAVRNLEFQDVDLSRIPDGTYAGEFGYGNFAYAVDVTVIGHRITEILVTKNRDGEHARLAEEVADYVLDAQSVQVDAVTGATTTSKALLKAIENALWAAAANP